MNIFFRSLCNVSESDLLKGPDGDFTLESYLSSPLTTKLRDQVIYFPLYFIPEQRHWDIVKDLINNGDINVGIIRSSDSIAEDNSSVNCSVGINLSKSKDRSSKVYNFSK